MIFAISDEVALSLGLLVIGFLLFVALGDYWLARTGRTTISMFCKRFADRPGVLLFAGLWLGLAVGTILGFILGHLVWPQMSP